MSGTNRTSMRKSQPTESGFSLVEIAIVLVIVSLLLSGAAMSLSSYVENGKQSATKTYLKETRTALLNFVAINAYLPCPDTDDDGFENRSGAGGGVCAATQGSLPYNNLELDRLTPWDTVAFYAVNSQVADTACSSTSEVCYFDSSNAPEFTLQSSPMGTAAGTGNLTVADLDGATVGLNVLLVVGSYGNNSLATEGGCAASNSADEQENCDSDTDFVMDTPTPTFDDQLIWLGANAVKGQVLEAGLF